MPGAQLGLFMCVCGANSLNHPYMPPGIQVGRKLESQVEPELEPKLHNVGKGDWMGPKWCFNRHTGCPFLYLALEVMNMYICDMS